MTCPDIDGEMKTFTINNRTIQYLYDGLDIVQEIENGLPSINYVRTLNIDEPLMRITADNTIRYYHTDALGSIIALSDDTGAIMTTYTYQPFGATIMAGESNDNPFQYTGRENDGTGFYYYRERYYSPELQRFISEDPIRFKGGINWFAYVENDPIFYRDPKGLWGVGVIPISGAAEAGISLGAGAQGTVGLGLFGGGARGLNAGTFVSSGGFAGGNPDKTGNSVFGAFAGFGAGAFWTNADCVQELDGDATTFSFNISLPFLPIKGSVQVSVDKNGTYVVSLTGGPGYGVSLSGYKTNTSTTK